MTSSDTTGIHILNATVTEIIKHTVNGINATAKTIAAAKPSELSLQMPWIELALIPIIPVIACYLFTKLAEYSLHRITRYRHRETATHLGINYRKMRAEMEESQPASFEPAQDKKKTHLSTPSTRLGNSTLPHVTIESSRMAGANAENPVIIGNSHALEQGEAATLTRGTRSRVFERGGVRGGVRGTKRGSGGYVEPREQLGQVRRRDSVGQKPIARVKAQGSGWWFDARWD